MRSFLISLAICVACCGLLVLWAVQSKPIPVVGLFFVNGLAVGSLYALGGIGILVLYRATGVLNLSAGAIGAASVMVAWQLGQWGVPAAITWVLGLCLGLVLAVAYGRVVAPKLSDRDASVKAVASLGYALILLGLVSFAWDDDSRRFGFPTDKMAVFILGLRVTVTRLIVVLAAVLLVVVISYGLTHSRIGLQMRSLANDRRISSLIGIPILRVESFAWGIGGLLFGFTGLMFGSLVRLDPAVITFLVIPCVAAAICGRLQSLPLALIGGLTIGVIESMLTLSPLLKDVRSMTPFVVAGFVLLAMNRGRKLTFAGDV